MQMKMQDGLIKCDIIFTIIPLKIQEYYKELW